MSVGDGRAFNDTAFRVRTAFPDPGAGKIVRPIKIKLVELTGHVNHFENPLHSHLHEQLLQSEGSPDDEFVHWTLNF